MVGTIGGTVIQFWHCMTEGKMKELKTEERKETGTLQVIRTDDVLSFAGLENKNVALSRSCAKDYNFGSIACDLLV